jgi:DNA-binding PadR family transcriptional regulator
MNPPSPGSDSSAPLKPTELHILLALSAGDTHGYALRQEVLRLTEGQLELEAGNLYRHVRRLEEQGLLEESGRRPPPSRDDERRRYYRLTTLGRRTLTAELRRMRAIVRLAEERRLIVPEAS